MTTESPLALSAAPAPSSPRPEQGAGAGTTGPAPRSGRSRRRRRRVVVVALVVLAGAAAATIARGWPGGDGGDDTSDTGPATGVATVERRTLVRTDDVAGTLDYGEPRSLTAGRDGTVTSVAAEGSTVERGQPLLSVDRHPVVLLVGAVPLYRDLASGVDDGPDVAQLEENLVALGFTDGGALTVDEHVDDATIDAVEAWQESLGVEETGTVTRGDAVFLPGPVRVAEVTVDVGTDVQASGEALTYTSTTHVARAQLDVAQADLAHVGDAVGVVLPDGSEVGGTVLAVAEPSSSGDASGATGTPGAPPTTAAEPAVTVEVTVALDDPGATSSYTTAGVDVRFRGRQTREDVLAVPVTALVALLETGYAVELAGTSGGGGGELLPVEVGMIADGWVEVSGDGITEGVEVVIPE